MDVSDDGRTVLTGVGESDDSRTVLTGVGGCE